MLKDPTKQNRLADAVRVIWLKFKGLWRKLGIWRKEDYPDWMMHIPNPRPPSDKPERKP